MTPRSAAFETPAPDVAANRLEAPARLSSPSSFIFRHLMRFRGAFVAALVWSILFVVIPMQVPLLAGMLVNGLLGQPATFYGFWTVVGSTRIFYFSVIGLVLVAAGYGATAYLRAYSVAELGRTFVREQRKDLVRKLDSSPLTLHQRIGSGELMSRVISDTESTRTFVTQVFFNTVQNGVRVIYPVLVLALLDPWLGLVAVAILPAQWVTSRRFQAGLRDASRTARTTKGRLTGAVKENLDGIEAIQTSNAEETAFDRVAREADQLARDQIRARTYIGLINGTTFTFTSVGIALAWWIGGWQVLQGSLTIGVLVAVTGYVALLYLPMQRFTSVANTYQKGMVAFERIREILEDPAALPETVGAPALRVSAGSIELRNVSFGYGTKRSLDGVNMTLRGGSLTALVGRNGSGKSTVLKLITRLYDPAQGAVLIDGQDLKHVGLRSVRAQVGVVPQSPVIFSGTVAENIRLGHSTATDSEVARAAWASGAHRFIERLPQGYATVLGTGGTRLSGGEAQQIAIARALVRRPRVLLLDEPNSALDVEAEAWLLVVLSRLKGEVTVVLVAHHLETVLEVADEVITMDGGRVVPPRAPAPLETRATGMLRASAAVRE